METAPKLVRELLLFSLLGFSPILLLAGLVGGLMIIFKLRGRKPHGASDQSSRLRSDDARRIARRIRRNKQSCLLFGKADSPGFSRLGGAPELPANLEWPEGADGQLRFLCQIDLAEARAAGAPEWLPTAGRLYAFHGEDYGSPDQVRVLYAPAEAELALACSRDASAWAYEERPIGFVRQDSLPSLDWLGEDLTAAVVAEDEIDRLVELSDAEWDEPLHKLGGYPDEIQDEQMAAACERIRNGGEAVNNPEAAQQATRNWRLLLQIDSDADLGTSFGGGRLYVFVRLQEARQACFDQTVTLLQM